MTSGDGGTRKGKRREDRDGGRAGGNRRENRRDDNSSRRNLGETGGGEMGKEEKEDKK